MTTPVDFYAHDLDVADNFAQKAIGRLRMDEIPPVPQNLKFGMFTTQTLIQNYAMKLMKFCSIKTS